MDETWGPMGTCSLHVFIVLSILGYEWFESRGGRGEDIS